MEIKDYQEHAMKTCTSNSNNIFYMTLGLSEEAGELNGKFAKAIRAGKYRIDPKSGQKVFDLTKEEWKLIRKEVGDVLWMLTGVCEVLGWKLEDVAWENILKLQDRQKRGVIEGNGDER